MGSSGAGKTTLVSVSLLLCVCRRSRQSEHGCACRACWHSCSAPPHTGTHAGVTQSLQLDVLACNVFGSGTVSGEVLVNGAPRRAREFSQISCYVMQRGEGGGCLACRDQEIRALQNRELLTLCLDSNLLRAVPPALSCPGTAPCAAHAHTAEALSQGLQSSPLACRPADVLLASSTVREALLIAALLKLPRDMPTAAKVAQVDAVLADLVRCRPVGSEWEWWSLAGCRW